MLLWWRVTAPGFALVWAGDWVLGGEDGSLFFASRDTPWHMVHTGLWAGCLAAHAISNRSVTRACHHPPTGLSHTPHQPPTGLALTPHQPPTGLSHTPHLLSSAGQGV